MSKRSSVAIFTVLYFLVETAASNEDKEESIKDLGIWIERNTHNYFQEGSHGIIDLKYILNTREVHKFIGGVQAVYFNYGLAPDDFMKQLLWFQNEEALKNFYESRSTLGSMESASKSIEGEMRPCVVNSFKMLNSENTRLLVEISNLYQTHYGTHPNGFEVTIMEITNQVVQLQGPPDYHRFVLYMEEYYKLVDEICPGHFLIHTVEQFYNKLNDERKATLMKNVSEILQNNHKMFQLVKNSDLYAKDLKLNLPHQLGSMMHAFIFVHKGTIFVQVSSDNDQFLVTKIFLLFLQFSDKKSANKREIPEHSVVFYHPTREHSEHSDQPNLLKLSLLVYNKHMQHPIEKEYWREQVIYLFDLEETNYRQKEEENKCTIVYYEISSNALNIFNDEPFTFDRMNRSLRDGSSIF